MPSRNAISVRKLTAAHYPEILEIWETSVRATHYFLSEEDISFYKPLILKYALPDVAVHGILSDKKICGFVGTSKEKTEMLFLRPECRKQGLGRKLLEFVINRLKIYTVDVNEENADALGFYLHLGYRIISRDEFDGNGKPHPILHLEYPHGDISVSKMTFEKLR